MADHSRPLDLMKEKTSRQMVSSFCAASEFFGSVGELSTAVKSSLGLPASPISLTVGRLSSRLFHHVAGPFLQ